MLESVLAARPKRYLMLNARDDRLDDVLALLPGLDAPTVLPLARSGMHAVHAVIDADDVVRLLGPLRSAGAIVAARPADRAPDPVTDLADRVRPGLARGSSYRWQEGLPDGPLDRFDMNTPPEAPAWYLPSIARLAALPANDYPDASYRPLKQAIAALRRRRRRARSRSGAGCDEVILLVAALGLGPGTGRAGAPTDVPAVHGGGAEPRRRRRRHRAPTGRRARLGRVPRRRRRARTSRSSARRTTRPDTRPSAELVRAVCAACPGIVFCDQAYVELGGLDHLAAGRRARQPDRRAHVLEGLRTRRRARRLRHRADRRSRPRSTRCDLRARSRPGPLRSARSPARQEDGDARARRPHRGRARSPRRRDPARRGVTVEAVAGNFVLGRMPTPDTFERLAARGLVVRTFAHEPLLRRLLPRDRLEPRRERPAVRGARRARRQVRRPSPERAPAAAAARCGVPRRRRASTARCSLDGSGRARVGDRPRLPRPPADRPRVLVDGRPRPPLLGRPLDRRAPHARGLRDRARRGARRRRSAIASA